ncbi:hypothetical protein DFH27DRAFT_356984 [Peziza echinospora]|nr:hypothetical protein DFH27DRAFT_356984 [Peziza echinospora]
MATLALQPICRTTPTPPPMTIEPHSLMDKPISPSAASGQLAASPMAIPNKHLANPLSPTPNGQTPPVTPPDSPPFEQTQCTMSSKLFPPDGYPLISDTPPVRSIDAAGVAAALNHTATQPLPSADEIFPWAHGVHPENHLQVDFFTSRSKRAVKKAPTSARLITIVKVGGDLSSSKLKGAVSPEEIIQMDGTRGFVLLDPKEGFSVRNFQIQVGKFATLSDIIVYGEESTSRLELDEMAKRISSAQLLFRSNAEWEFPVYNTFVVQDRFSVFEELFPELVAIDSKGKLTGNVVEFCKYRICLWHHASLIWILDHWERSEMCTMSRATEISRNVFLGSTADAGLDPNHQGIGLHWSVMIEASDLAHVPGPSHLRMLSEALEASNEPLVLEFPSSGSVFSAPYETDGIVEMCRWIYSIANEDGTDGDGDTRMSGTGGKRKILIHCTDGYTETSLLALAYTIFAEGLAAHDAWLYLHNEKKRNFFAYTGDLGLLRNIQQRLLRASPRGRAALSSWSEPKWVLRMDGSLPSRILPYMYLGNLPHANNPALLNALGIKRILSVGELTSWTPDELKAWGKSKILPVENVQDNGIDSLSSDFRRCLDFIDEGRRNGEPTLVHCRVGVSRSATICIAEVMRALGLSLPRAYCFVRARRLNVIIQPHCRFMYELLKWEEIQQNKQNVSIKREMEWATVAREVAAMNRPYSSR